MSKILSDTEKYVTGLFLQNNNDKLRYHNIVHTKSVVKAAELIGGKCEHIDGDIDALLVAAWFHDVGYLETEVGHEEVSKRYARKFLEKKGTDEAFIQQVERAIEATKLPQNPKDRLSAALCDADLYHVSQDDFMENTQIFWDELAAMNGEDMDEFKYLGTTLKFLNEHRFQTEYGQTLLEPGKQANLKKVREAFEKYSTSGKNQS